MKSLLAAGALAISLSAWADDSVTTERKDEAHTGKNKTSMKSETKTTHDPEGLLNSTTDTATQEESSERKAGGGSVTTSEKTVSHDAPGMKNDKKHSVKRKVTRDANGNVTADESNVK